MELWWGEAPAQQPSVLVVDDDRALSTMVAFVLRQSGFSVDVANSGEDALVRVGDKGYDAIVLDQRMPGKDGRTVFREMRHAGIATPVLILSAYDARQARDELGAESFMSKPLEPESLVEALYNMLQGTSANRW